MVVGVLVSMKGDAGMEEKVVSILNEMAEYLSVAQMKKLQEVMFKNLSEKELMKKAKSMSKSDLIEELVLAWLKIEEIESNRYYYE